MSDTPLTSCSCATEDSFSIAVRSVIEGHLAGIFYCETVLRSTRNSDGDVVWGKHLRCPTAIGCAVAQFPYFFLSRVGAGSGWWDYVTGRRETVGYGL